MKLQKKFEYLDHPADIKIRAFGNDLQELFINTALGMMDFLFGELQKSNHFAFTNHDNITVDAENLESLLVNWLAEILALSNINKCAYFEYKIISFDLIENKIVAELSGTKLKAKDDIKAVTYHELSIKQENEIWTATVVYDI